MDFFVSSRDPAGTEALRDDRDLLEQHWSFMDAFADSMVAIGDGCEEDLLGHEPPIGLAVERQPLVPRRS